MIDALMYGITPSAKTVSLASAPPVNISKNRRIEPCCASKKAVSAAPSIPGVGICAPSRKIRSIANVKKMRCLSSSIRKIFCIMFNIKDALGYFDHFSPGFFYYFRSICTCRIYFNLNFFAQFAFTRQFYWFVFFFN